MPRILVVDDEKNIRRALTLVLEGEGYEVRAAATAEEARARLGEQGADVLLLDVKLPGASGIELLEGLVSSPGARPQVVMISGHATIDDAVRATKLGAFDFLEKPLDRGRVLVAVRNAAERAALEREVEALRGGGGELLGESPGLRTLRTQIAKVAPTRSRVLITGESGTGKELVARAIHRGSAVVRGEFVRVNCAAIPAPLIESELFGHERGAFTGAVGQKRGLFELAHGGTLFLDEVGDLALPAQANLLRVLQTGELTRVGGERSVRSDARVVAATNHDLESAVAEGRFRDDLYFRLNVLRLHVPPLRDHLDDLPLLVEHFVAQCCREQGIAPKEVTAEAMALLAAQRWPGNVRQLRNTLERAVILGGDAVTIDDLGDEGRERDEGAEPSGDGERTLRAFREAAERDFIRRALERHAWNISRTAEALGVERSHLHRKLRAFGIARDG